MVKQVTALERVLTLSPSFNSLDYSLGMAAVDQPLQSHLVARLERALALPLAGVRALGQRAQLLDVREAHEIAADPYPPALGAVVCVPLAALRAALAAAPSGDGGAGLVRDLARPVVALCQSGSRAREAAELLRTHNFPGAVFLPDGVAACAAALGV